MRGHIWLVREARSQSQAQGQGTEEASVVEVNMDKMRGYACIGLDDVKNSINIGSVLRCAGNYGAIFVAISGQRYKKACTDTMKQYRHIPLLQVQDLKIVIPYDCTPVAVDLITGARNIIKYIHPERAFYIFGAEDATLGRRILSFCRDVIYVPTNRCMNLAATVHVVLYDRMAKIAQKRISEVPPRLL